MCTVTFIPHAAGVIMASNRDEQVLRRMAQMPAAYQYNNRTIVFPKDGQAGGTWIGMNDSGQVMVLMNGGYQRHQMGGTYRKSRGLIFLDIFQQEDPYAQFEKIDLDQIEPFTLILWTGKELWDLRWDGAQKHKTPADPGTVHIWSSAQLYTPEVRRQREVWFREWLEQTDIQHISVAEVTAFHTFGGNGGDEENRLVMHLGDFLKTISITTIDWQPGNMTMHYHDLVQDVSSSETLRF